MIIRNFVDNDTNYINNMGKKLHDNYFLRLDDFSNCLVATIDDKIVGFITYSIIYDRAEIIDLYIDLKYRNKGYAKALIGDVITISKKCNCYNITLEVEENNNAAIKLYESFGFKKVSVRKNYYKHGDGFLMEKDLR